MHPAALSALLNRGYAVDSTNPWGKTALMAAAQANELESARLLLARRASVNAITISDPNPTGQMLADDARTPLMYAAANGSLALIKLLLAAGADPYQADSKGKRAIDYLLGYGPTAFNASLGVADREEAARLLF